MEYIILGIIAVAIVLHFFKKVNDTPKPTTVKSAKPVVKKESAHNVADLKKLTKVQLLDLADKNTIKVKRSGSKAEVIKAMSTHQK